MAQNLGQLLGAPSSAIGVNPFGGSTPRRRVVDLDRDELPANYGTGFSPDGMSYEVIKDFGKIAAKALADYEAQINNQRQQNLSLDSRGIVTAKPVDVGTSDAIYNSTIAPLERMFGGGTQAFRPPQPMVRGGGANPIFERNPETGNWDMVVPAPDPTPKAPDKFPLPTELNLMRQPSGVKMLTMPQIEALLPSLPERLRTNAPASTYQSWLNSSNSPAISAPPMEASAGRKITKELAAQFLQQARGDKEIARRLARESGYSF